ncbi:MAG: hypothetical protein RLY21_1395 [Planctomycetota bacterium]|jgi:hypothetical protein
MLHHLRTQGIPPAQPAMTTLFQPLRRSLSTLVLATALTTPIVGLAPTAQAQFGPRLPSPVAATELESMLKDAGADQAAIARALPLHEAYFQLFREFEEREVDASLKRADSATFGQPMTVEEARQNADLRRRIFARAAQIDSQLVEQVVATLPPDAAARVDALRNALARRRAIAAIPSNGLSKGAHAFDLRGAPVLASLDAETRATIAPLFATYEQELTRQLDRLAEASFVRRVRAAEARIELGVGAAPDASGEGDPAAPPGAEEAEWVRKMQEVQRIANEESSQIDARIRKLHRDTLDAVSAALPPVAASGLRTYLVREVYPSSMIAGEFDSARKEAEALRAKGSLDDARWTEVVGIIETHDTAMRADLDALLTKLDATVARGVNEFVLVGEQDPVVAEIQSARDRCNQRIVRDAAALRAALGQTAAQPREAVVGRAVDIGEMGVAGGVQIAVMGGDGEAITLGADDLSDGGIVLGGMFGGGSDAVVKPMSGEELDRLAQRLGFDENTRIVFDEIVAQCAEARNEAEKTDDAKKTATPAPEEGGAIAMTLTIGEDGAVALGSSGPADPRALAQAIDAAEERMFDDLKAVADPSKTGAVESERRARARTRLLVGERGAQTADIVAIVDAASLDASQRASVAEDVRGWDESSVAALRAMRDEVVRATDEREKLMEQASKSEQTVQDGDQTRIARAVQIDGALMEEMRRLDQRTRDARDKVIVRNRSAIETLVAKLESNPAAAKAIRRGFYRVLEPGAYRIARDLEPFFAKASEIDTLKPETRAQVDALRAEWIESREALCEAFAAEREKERTASKDGGPAGVVGIGSIAMNSQARKRLASDLEQLETTTFRKLRETLVAEVGEDKAASIGELPAKKKRGAPAIQFGG